MRKTFLFSVAVASLPGEASATSTTCATTVMCAEDINTWSGVAIHGEANTGIGIRAASVSNTGSTEHRGSETSAAPGVEGESTNASGSDDVGGFGLGFLAGCRRPASARSPRRTAHPSLGVVETAPIGLHAVAEPGSRFTSIAIFAESSSYPLEFHNTNDHT